MRGKPEKQCKGILIALNRLGTSRHKAKKMARKFGARTPQQIAKKTGIHSRSTLETYRKVITQFLTWSFEEYEFRNAAKVTPEMIEHFLQEKLAEGRSARTIATYCAALEKMSVGLSSMYKREYNWTPVIDKVREDIRKYSPVKTKSRAYQNPDKIIKKLDGKMRLIALIQGSTGYRVNEITKLTKENIVDNSHLKLTNTKGGKIRTVLMEHIQNEIDINGKFEFDYFEYRYALKNACYETGEQYNGTHGLRWTYAHTKTRNIVSRIAKNCVE